MFRFARHNHTEAAREAILSKRPPLSPVGGPVARGACGYRMEAASRRAGLGSTLGRDNGTPRPSGTAAPR